MAKADTKKFVRNGKTYTAVYEGSNELVRLIDQTTGRDIPRGTQSFRRLADNNRGNRFKSA